MPAPLHVPRINNNDDTVRVVSLLVELGGWVRGGEVVAEIETDKSVAQVEAERDGFVLKILGASGGPDLGRQRLDVDRRGRR